jgi:hypothetical protein
VRVEAITLVGWLLSSLVLTSISTSAPPDLLTQERKKFQVMNGNVSGGVNIKEERKNYQELLSAAFWKVYRNL